MLRGHCAAAVAVTSFSCRKDAVGKARGASEYFANARNFDNVYADGNDHGSNRSGKRRLLLART